MAIVCNHTVGAIQESPVFRDIRECPLHYKNKDFDSKANLSFYLSPKKEGGVKIIIYTAFFAFSNV